MNNSSLKDDGERNHRNVKSRRSRGYSDDVSRRGDYFGPSSHENTGRPTEWRCLEVTKTEILT